MPGESVKAYVYLLCESWLNEPRGTLPDDDIELASMARCNEAQWMLIKPTLEQFFKKHEDGYLYNDKLMDISNGMEIKALNRKNKTGTKRKQTGNKT